MNRNILAGELTMATHNSNSTSAHSKGGPAAQKDDQGRQVVEYEEFIESQLRKTRSHVRSVDVASSLMTLAAGTLAYFFLAAVVDHWVIAGGLGLWGRLLLLAAYVGVVLAYLATQVLPLLLRRINPVYAAYTIERSRPTLKNALVNFLFFRDNPAGLSDVVYHAIEEQAATNLAKVEVDVAVDRSKLIRIGYALLGILIVCAVYTLMFPKDLLKTVGRVAMPWAEISQPTRTSIVEIEPGNAQAFRGQKVAVSARIQELPAGAKVMLVYTTADGQTVDRAVEMQLLDDGFRHSGTLPGGEGDLQQNLEYRIEAGDAISSRYQLEVVSAPTIVVRAVQYKYPPYTGLLDQRVEHQGDVKAIEGTEITLDAVANQDIQSADVDFDCDQRPDQRMRWEKQQAQATFRLTLKDDRKTPEHASYQLLFKNEKGQQNPQPVRQQIEISRDVAPEIQFLAPKKDEIDLPLNETVQLEIVANDPDFALRLVKLSATSGKQPLFDKILLDQARRGQFVNKFRFEPRKLGLKAGDVVEYSALAEDNKDPRPNRTETAKRRIRIVSPDPRQSRQDQVAKNDQQGEEPSGDEKPRPGTAGNRGDDPPPRDNDAPGDPKSDKAQQTKGEKRDDAASDKGDAQQPDEAHQAQGKDEGDAQQGENSAGQPGQQRSADNKAGKSGEQKAADKSDPSDAVPSDGSDDGDAIDQILKHRDEQQDKANPKSKDSRSKQRGDEGQKSGEQQAGEQPKGEPQSSGEHQADAQKDPSPADGQKPQKKPGESGDRGQQKSADKGHDPQNPEPKNQDRGEHGDQPDAKQNADPKPDGEQQQDQPGGKQGGERKKPSPQQRDKSEPAAGQKEKGEKGGGAGHDNSEDGSDGGEKGQKGKPDKGSPKGGKAGKPSDDGEAEGEDSAEPGAKSKGGKPTPAKPDDQPNSDNAAEDGDGAGKPQSRKTKPADKSDHSPAKPGKEQGPGDGDSQDAAGETSGEKPDGKSDPNTPGKSADEKKAADKNPPDRGDPDAQENGTPQRGKPDGQPKPGQGAKSEGDPTRDAKQKPSRDSQKPDAKGGDGENQKGKSGAGQSGSENKGSPAPQEPIQPRDKSQQSPPDDKDSKPDDQAQSPANSKRESNSQGSDDGDRAGGGKRGGGQKANKPGTGGPGQNTAADEGAGRSDEPGDGETGERAGDGPEAHKPTGKSGSNKGDGSATKPSTGQGDKQGQGDAPKGDSPQSPGEASKGDQEGAAGQAGAGGNPKGGKPGNNSTPNEPFKPIQDEAEAANLDYARKASDLALEHLKDQLKKDQPDPDLLNRLGWTRKDLESFVKRWEQMRKQAQSPGEQGTAARKELDETLRSLGLRPRATSLKGNAGRDDQARGLKESRRTTPPAEYAEQTKAYSQGTARGGK